MRRAGVTQPAPVTAHAAGPVAPNTLVCLQSTAATAARVEQLEAEAEAARVAHRAEAAALAAELGRTQEVPARHAPRAFPCQLLCWCLV